MLVTGNVQRLDETVCGHPTTGGQGCAFPKGHRGRHGLKLKRSRPTAHNVEPELFCLHQRPASKCQVCMRQAVDQATPALLAEFCATSGEARPASIQPRLSKP